MTDPLVPLLAEELKNAREGSCLSQAKAGQAIFRSDRKIRFIETGEQVPDLLEFLQLMQAYHCDPAQFLLELQQRFQLQQKLDHASE